MKKPYITEFERRLIEADTLSGAFIEVRFRWKQFVRALLMNFNCK